MTEIVNAAMLEIQAAMLARSLYPAEHPRIRNCEQRAHRMLSELLTARAELSVFAVEDRVVTDDSILSASASLSESIFKRLKRRGVDRLTFLAGLEELELQCFLDALGTEDGVVPIRATEHLAIGYIRKRTEVTDEDAQVLDALPPAGADNLSGAFEEVWNDFGKNRRFDSDKASDIVREISRALRDNVGAVLPVVQLKTFDEYTFVHTINVAILSTALCEAVGFTGPDAHDLSLAALLHDVGKQIIPTTLLNKTGRFTDEEFRLVQLHPVEGARMLLGAPGVPEIAPIVAFEHHIRADGSGYPRVPRHWRLNLASRIVQVADVFDALRTHRPYRPALPLLEIVALMKKDVGVFFDADLLDVFFQRVVTRGLPTPTT